MSKPAFTLRSLLLVAAVLGPGAATAADDDLDNCRAILAELPARIGAKGVVCLTADLSTTIATGLAVEINASDVVLDCKGHRLIGSARDTDQTTGIGTGTRAVTGVVVRNCHVSGFRRGIQAAGRPLLEDNLVFGSGDIGIHAGNAIVRRNRVLDTGGFAGIYATGTSVVVDNAVSGVAPPAGSNKAAYGIVVYGSGAGSLVAGNRVGNLARDGSGRTIGIYLSNAQRATLRGNSLVGDDSTGSTGLSCADDTSIAMGNVVAGFRVPLKLCRDGGGLTQAP